MSVNYGAKRIVVGAHYGLRDWLAQRVTAVLIALFTLVVLLQVVLGSGEIGYDKWAGIFAAQSSDPNKADAESTPSVTSQVVTPTPEATPTQTPTIAAQQEVPKVVTPTAPQITKPRQHGDDDFKIGRAHV